MTKFLIKSLLISFFTFSFTTQLVSQNISINEFMSSNDIFLQDKDGDYSDWIELYNDENQAINLQAFSLSDDANELNKWIFPNVIIPAKGFLLIFASGKNSTSTTELHTNFKISQSGEPLLLSYSNQLISSTFPVSVPTDQSYGSIQDGSNSMVYFAQPTPNETNENSNVISASHISGFYSEAFLLTLIASDSNQTIYYTLNGKIPTINDQLYTSSLLIKNNSNRPNSISNIPTTAMEGPKRLQKYIWQPPNNVYKSNIIRYAIFENNVLKSPIYSKTYFVDSSIYDRYKFPVISLITDSLNLFGYEEGIYIAGKLFDDIGFGEDDVNFFPVGNYNNQGNAGEKLVHITYMESDGTLGFEADAGMRIRGQGSAIYAQKSLNIYFRKEYGINKIEYPIFEGKAKNKRFILRNSGQDFPKTHFRDALLQSILEPLEMELQASEPTILFINGEYWGIHNIREKFDKFYFENRFDIEEDNLNLLGICGSEEHGSNTDYMELMNYVYEHDFVDNADYEYAAEKFDILNLINYQIAEIFYGNYDWPCNNYKIWKTNEPDSKWRYLIYDLDLAFGTTPLSAYDRRGFEHATILKNDWPHCECSNIMFVKLLENETFKSLFIAKFEEYLNTIFKAEIVIDKINDFKRLYAPEMREHVERWNYPSSVSTWYENVKELEAFAIKRPCFLKENLKEYFELEDFDFQCLDDDRFEKKETVLVYPNPTTDKIWLKNNEIDNHLIGNLHVLNTNGQVVFLQNDFILEGEEAAKLSLPNLPNGVYFIMYQNIDFMIGERFVIMR